MIVRLTGNLVEVGSDSVVMTKPDANFRVAWSKAPSESVKVNAGENRPDSVGVPEIVPPAESRIKPAGRLPPLRAQV